jgi:endonuclease I/chitodextrinase
MEKKYILLFILSSIASLAQIPAGYYNNATGTGYALKTQLYNIINPHTNPGYDGLYVTYQNSDVDTFYENDGTVLDMYSENPTGADPYNYSLGATQRCGNYNSEGDCYNREHIIPQSVFGSANPMVADAHFITPTDGKVNGYRSNFPHGNVGIASWTSLNGSKLGSSSVSGYSGTVFEPINEFKGDIARMYFYFVTCYQNNVAGYPYDMFNGTSNQSFTTPFLNMLLAWNTLDPVSPREISRNNAIYARQGNRNPYIDHPEYVSMVWTNVLDTQAPTAATNLVVTTTTSSTATLNWTAGTDNIGIASYDVYVNGVLNTSATGTTITINGLLPTTTYTFYVVAKDASANVSPASNTVSGTTLAGTVNTGVCGTSNFETIPANASSYTSNTWTNSGITWVATDSRTDQTINTRAITVRNGSLSASATLNGISDFTITTQLKFAGSAGTFNLRVNGNVVGTIPYSATLTTTTIPAINIPGNVTISITDNSTATNRVAFDDLTWNCFSTFSVNEFNADDFNIYPNPSNGNFTIDFTKEDEKFDVEIFSLIGQKVFKQENVNQNISISNLQQGIYLLKIIKENKSIIKKIIIK